MLLCAMICDARVGEDVRDVHGRDLGMEMGKLTHRETHA